MNLMVDFILKNLLSKEVLYGPLVEIRDRYPDWIKRQKLHHLTAANETKIESAGGGGEEGGGGGGEETRVSMEELSRYELQHQAIIQVCNQVLIFTPFPHSLALLTLT